MTRKTVSVWREAFGPCRVYHETRRNLADKVGPFARALAGFGAMIGSECGGADPARRERRSRARHDALEALGWLLDSARRAGKMDAVALADDSGCLVAGAGAWRACQELAAYAPLLASAAAPANDVVPTRLDVLALRFEVRRLTINGVEVLLCGRGDNPAQGAGMSHAEAGCQRILSERRRA